MAFNKTEKINYLTRYLMFRLSTSSKHKLNCQQTSNEACRLQSLVFSSPRQATLVGDPNILRTFGIFLAKKAKQKPSHSSSVARNFVWPFYLKNLSEFAALQAPHIILLTSIVQPNTKIKNEK